MLPITRHVAQRSSTGSFRLDFPAAAGARDLWNELHRGLVRFSDRRGSTYNIDEVDEVEMHLALPAIAPACPRAIDRSIPPITSNDDWT